jgi:hypothetical protein
VGAKKSPQTPIAAASNTAKGKGATTPRSEAISLLTGVVAPYFFEAHKSNKIFLNEKKRKGCMTNCTQVKKFLPL